MNASIPSPRIATRRPAPDDPLLRWLGSFLQVVAMLGMGLFGLYIVLRAAGATIANFEQWQPLLEGRPMPAARDWVANLGIGLHFVMGVVLVLAWPILLSARIRARHRAVHRWTGRIYVGAALLAGLGGMSFILGHGAYLPEASVAFAIWGGVMMASAVMAFVHARAKRFDRHRAWAIRLFAMVLGSWLFDIEIRAWKDFAGGVGFGRGGDTGPMDYAILYLFFVPNLLVAEFFIRNGHRRIARSRMKWPVVAVLAATAVVFACATFAVTASGTGKYGRHLLHVLGG